MRSLVDRTIARFGRLDPVNNAGTEGKAGPVQYAENYAAAFDTTVRQSLSFRWPQPESPIFPHCWTVRGVRCNIPAVAAERGLGIPLRD